MERLACVDLPAFPLQLLLKRNPDWMRHPAAVVDEDKAQGTLLWVNEHARALNILPGLRYSSALSLSRELRAGVIEPSEVDQEIERIAQRLRFFTPEVEPSTEPGVFWLSARGLSLLHPSLRRWMELVYGELTKLEWVASAVLGFSRFGTYAAAKALRRGTHLFTEPFEEEIHGKSIPIDRLGFDPKLRDELAKLGIRTLGGFLELPSSGLLERFGPDVHRLYKMAKGELWSPLQPSIPLEPVQHSLDLDYSEKNLERLMLIVEEITRSLLPELAARNQALAALRLRLKTDDGRTIRESLRPAAPTLDVPQLCELLQLRLQKLLGEGLTSNGGIVEIGLLFEGVAASREQLSLFAQMTKRDPEAARRAFARLRAELGEDSVLCAQLKDGHLPEARFVWKRLRQQPVPEPRTVQRRPRIRRFYARPIPLSTQKRNEPDGWMIRGLEDGPVEEITGPFTVSGGWWRREVHREYHYVRTRDGGWLWVYFDRRRRRWYLQGVVE